jgi:hypothetical protein
MTGHSHKKTTLKNQETGNGLTFSPLKTHKLGTSRTFELHMNYSERKTVGEKIQ